MKSIIVYAALMLLGIQSINAQNETNECGTIIVPAIYESIEVANDGLFIVGTDKNMNGLCEKNGVIDSNGKIIVPVEYQSVVLGKKGIDRGGLILVSNKFLGDDNFYHSKDGLYNKEGVQIVPMGKYESLGIGYNGFVSVSMDKSSFRLYKDGKISPPYDEISQEEGCWVAVVSKDGLKGALNQNGEIIIPIKYKYISTKSNGLIEVGTLGGRKWGVYNDKGQVIVPIGKYEHINIDYDKYIKVEKDGKEGVLNRNGAEIVPIGMYEKCWVSRCRDKDHYFVEIESNKERGAVNDNGKVFIPIGKYQRFSVLNNSLLTIVESNGKKGIVDKNGTVVIPIGKYEKLVYEYGVLTYFQNEKWGVLDEKGKQVTPAEYEKIDPARHSIGMALVVKDEKVGVINNRGQLVVPLGNYYAGSIVDKVVWLRSDNGTTFFNLDGKILSPEGCYEKCQQKYGKLEGAGLNRWPLPLNPNNSEEGLFEFESDGKFGIVKLW